MQDETGETAENRKSLAGCIDEAVRASTHAAIREGKHRQYFASFPTGVPESSICHHRPACAAREMQIIRYGAHQSSSSSISHLPTLFMLACFFVFVLVAFFFSLFFFSFSFSKIGTLETKLTADNVLKRKVLKIIDFG